MSNILKPAVAKIALPNYRQTDSHSCGFVAALTVIHYFAPNTPVKAVRAAIGPTEEEGCDQDRMIRALKQFGITARYRDDLDTRELFRLTEEGTPAIVTIWPDNYCCDHWTVIRGIAEDRISLANYGKVSLDEFESVWFDQGEGLVCITSQLAAAE
jgi:hypothetical protein